MREQVVKDIEKTFLEPSFRYLVENGLENTSVRDLCKEMKVSYGSLYYWFEGKEDIYISVINYGLSKIVIELFQVVFERIVDLDLFFSTFIDEVDKYKKELRLIIQFATSHEYGELVREKTKEFNLVYERYIVNLARILNLSGAEVAPIIYMLISILADYVVWEDRQATDMQMNFLYNTLQSMKLDKARDTVK